MVYFFCQKHGLFLLLVILMIDVDDRGKSVYKGLFQGAVLLGLGEESENLGLQESVGSFCGYLLIIGNGPLISLHYESSAPCLMRSL